MSAFSSFPQFLIASPGLKFLSSDFPDQVGNDRLMAKQDIILQVSIIRFA